MDKDIMFYLVVYLTDGTIHLWPGEDKEICEKTQKKISKSKWKDRIKHFRIIKRNLNNYENGYFL